MEIVDQGIKRLLVEGSKGEDPNWLIEMRDGRLVRLIVPQGCELQGGRWAELKAFMNSDEREWLERIGYIPKHTRCPYKFNLKGTPATEGYFVERVHPFTRRDEWCNVQRREAGLLLARVNIELETMKSPWRAIDCHSNNVTFRHSNPIFVDTGAFSTKYHHWIIPSLHEGIEDWDLPTDSLMEFYERLLGMNAPMDEENIWDDYNQSEMPRKTEDIAAETEEEKEVMKGVSHYIVKSIFDAGSNDGKFARLFAKRGIDVLSVDNAARMVRRNHLAASWFHLPITCAKLDLTDLIYKIERFRCDMVFGASITHHLWRAGFKFDLQAGLWDELAEKYLLLEYIDPKDKDVATWGVNYSFKDFSAPLEERKWSLVNLFNPQSPERTWSLWVKEGGRL